MILVRAAVLILLCLTFACRTASPVPGEEPLTDAMREARIDALLDPVIVGLKQAIQDRKAGMASFTKEGQDYEPTVSRYLVPRIIDRLVRDGVIVIERRDLDKVVREIEQQMSDMMDESTCVEPGLISGVDLLVLGTVQDRSLGVYRIGIKVLDLETATIRWTGHADLPREFLPVKFGGK
ncbi:MAG: hypothetical protein ABIK28_09310 [Planctomycetota bacterium]